MSDLQLNGIHVTPLKRAGSTGKCITLAWTDELREAVEGEVGPARPDLALALLPRNGECYVKKKPAGQADGSRCDAASWSAPCQRSR